MYLMKFSTYIYVLPYCSRRLLVGIEREEEYEYSVQYHGYCRITRAAGMTDVTVFFYSKHLQRIDTYIPVGHGRGSSKMNPDLGAGGNEVLNTGL